MLRGADRKANALVWVQDIETLLQGSEGRVALEALCESSSAFWSEVVPLETASEGAGKVHVKGR